MWLCCRVAAEGVFSMNATRILEPNPGRTASQTTNCFHFTETPTMVLIMIVDVTCSPARVSWFALVCSQSVHGHITLTSSPRDDLFACFRSDSQGRQSQGIWLWPPKSQGSVLTAYSELIIDANCL